MRILKTAEVPHEDSTKRPIFFGGTVTSQAFVNEQNSKFFNMSIVNFDKGARNKFHIHSSDQILFVTKGRGIVADDQKEYEVSEGTAIHIPAGEKHWHGASATASFAHITVTAVGSTTEIVG